MEEILNNMDTMQKLMSSIAVTYDTSDESPESQWSKLYFEDLEDLENVSEQQMHLSETKINALINSGAMAISDVFNSGKYNGINTFCMAMPVRQKVYSIRLTRLCIILKRMVKVRHIYHKNREY